MRNLFVWGHARTFCNHALLVGKPELARAEYDLVKQALVKFPPVFLDGIQYDENYEHRLADSRRVSGWRGVLARLGRRAPEPKDELPLPPPPGSRLKASLHAQEAICHETKGILLAAQDSWHAAALSVGVVTPEQVGHRTDRKYGWAAVTS